MFKLLLLSVLSFYSTLGASLQPKGLVPSLDGRIVGGVPAAIESFPHQISLRFYGSHRCGGSIYKSDIIITAAHCTADINPSNLLINAGSTYRNKDGDGIQRNIKSIVEHEDFNPYEYRNDVAILRLEEELIFNQHIQPIPLASPGEILKAGTMVQVSGWGTLESGGYPPDNLQVVYLAVVDRDVCASAYKDINAVTNDMMCAGESGKDSCQGDSGGPLICAGKLHGIVSWGYGCAFHGFPGVYSSVEHLRNWIDFKITVSPFSEKNMSKIKCIFGLC